LQLREGLGRLKALPTENDSIGMKRQIGYSWLHYDYRLTIRTPMGKKILGLDLGSNSIGWALLKEDNGKPNEIINIGSRIFTKAVETVTNYKPTRKSQLKFYPAKFSG
jgi:hypothetical protein